jgi:glycosyltransferase involved in cell wall biosynthesis
MSHSSQPLVSIIMPTYNRAKYIAESIQSVQSQTYTYWELLIEDDGSDDNTEDIVNSITDNRIHYTRHPRTAITGTLRNKAIQRAKGAYIAFMDSDDLWVANKLEQQVTLMEQNLAAGFSVTNWCDFRVPGQLESPYHETANGVTVGNIFREHCTADLLFHITTLIFRKDCVEKTGMFNENRLFTDYSFMGLLAYYYDAVVIYKPMLHRRVHAGNSVNASWCEDFEEYQESVHLYLEKGWINIAIVRQPLFLSYINLGEKFAGVKDRRRAIKNYLKAWEYKPFSIIPAKKLVKTLFL